MRFSESVVGSDYKEKCIDYLLACYDRLYNLVGTPEGRGLLRGRLHGPVAEHEFIVPPPLKEQNYIDLAS